MDLLLRPSTALFGPPAVCRRPSEVSTHEIDDSLIFSGWGSGGAKRPAHEWVGPLVHRAGDRVQDSGAAGPRR